MGGGHHQPAYANGQGGRDDHRSHPHASRQPSGRCGPDQPAGAAHGVHQAEGGRWQLQFAREEQRRQRVEHTAEQLHSAGGPYHGPQERVLQHKAQPFADFHAQVVTFLWGNGRGLDHPNGFEHQHGCQGQGDEGDLRAQAGDGLAQPQFAKAAVMPQTDPHSPFTSGARLTCPRQGRGLVAPSHAPARAGL
jgi:hypothetical protein